MLVSLLLASSMGKIEVDVRSQAGLTVSYEGIPIIRGSWFQLFDEKGGRGLYSSTWNPQKIESPQPGVWRLSFSGVKNEFEGSQEFVLEGNTLTIKNSFLWKGAGDTNLELCSGMLWSIPFSQIKDGNIISRSAPDTKDTVEKRSLARARMIGLNSPLGQLTIQDDTSEIDLFDARNYDQSWAEGKSLLWLGKLKNPLKSGQVWQNTIRISLPQEKPRVARRNATFQNETTSLPIARKATTKQEEIIPKPKRISSGDGYARLHPATLINLLRTQNLHSNFLSRWDPTGWQPNPNTKYAKLSFRVAATGLPAQGYRINTSGELIEVIGQDAEGLRYGIFCLLDQLRSNSQDLVLPIRTLEDWPSNPWRGVHLFVGPDTPKFHPWLWDRALRGLRLNRVVLQCERTNWQSLPGIETPINMSVSQLSELTAYYRNVGVELIPLIQSMGHMGWFFANRKNLDLAMNPNEPFGVDPRKPGTSERLRLLWDEVIRLIQPKTIHFGMDEINLRGWDASPQEITQMWKLQMPILEQITRKHKVKGMIWGDMGLATSEAIDAQNGDNLTESKQRRAAIPAGFQIADWHYKDQDNVPGFLQSLNLWKSENYQPIAATWFRPQNVRAFNLAAIEAKAGSLITTWAGYESNETNLLREFKQFSAMVLAGEYSWSGRNEPLSKLPYEAHEVMARRLYGAPNIIRSTSGNAVGNGTLKTGEHLSFREMPPVVLDDLFSSSPSGLGQVTLNLKGGATAREVWVWLEAQTGCDDGFKLGSITIRSTNGKIVSKDVLYGYDVRAQSDKGRVIRTTPFERGYAMRIDTKTLANIQSLSLKDASLYGGLTLKGITLIP